MWQDIDSAPGKDRIRLHAVRIVCDEQVTAYVAIEKEINVEIDFWNLKPDAFVSTSIHLLDKMGIGVLA